MTPKPDTFSLFSIRSAAEFEKKAMEVFSWQRLNNPVYKKYIEYLDLDPVEIRFPGEIPFLPAAFFRTHPVRCGNKNPETVFTSSSTTGSNPARHEVTDLSLYRTSLLTGFERVYGKVEGTCILALLPAYLERPGSSLVFMAKELILKSGHPHSGFFLHNLEELASLLRKLDPGEERILLLGVSFALLDLAAFGPFRLKHTLVMETGGMKGRRKELTREELHESLKKGFGVDQIHSEYGMTELLSQAYSTGDGIFQPPPWMRVLIRDRYDPFHFLPDGQTGGINVIDLANLNSCSFIETQDLGRILPGGGFEVLGRYDQGETRGCNLMYY